MPCDTVNPTKPDSHASAQKAEATTTRSADGNTPIARLMAEYAGDGFDFSDLDAVKRAALRYVETMPDSQVRTLLYALAAPRQPWLCTCGTPSLPGVLHRADRPCAAVRDEGAE
jgi:hypothetical protein